MAIAMGIQNTAARQLAVPDLTTTVLTMTVTGIAADATLAGGPGSKLGRRGLSIAAMLLGALIGGLLVLRVDNAAPLALATGLLALISLLSYPRSAERPRGRIPIPKPDRRSMGPPAPSGRQARMTTRGADLL